VGLLYARRMGRWLSTEAPAVDAEGPALDLRVRVPGAQRDTTLRTLFAATRARGLTPHASGPQHDHVVARSLVGLLPDGSGAPARNPDIDPPASLVEPERSLSPSDLFGVAEPACPKTAPKEAIFGSAAQIIGDLRDMGAGAVRRCKYRDVYWGSLFPNRGSFVNGTQVPPPAEILASLRADDHAVLADFTELLIACRLAGIRMAITPFDSGGGSAMNVNTAADATRNDADRPLADGSWADLLAHKPSWQHGVRVPSTEGWDPFYWDHSGDHSAEQEHFQRYALQVWPTRASDPITSDDYTRECARRKSLALSAFCQGVAEHLADLHEVWLDLLDNLGVYAAVDTVELGNELNGFFVYRSESGASPEVLQASHREAGRTMVALASPFQALLTGLRFRASELSAWRPMEQDGACEPEPGCCVADDYEERLGWLLGAIGDGMPDAVSVEVLNQYATAIWTSSGGSVALPADVADWWLSCAVAGYWWPPRVDAPADVRVLTAPDLVDEVGLHWFHQFNRRVVGTSVDKLVVEPWIPGYADAIRLAQDLDRLDSVVVDGLRSLGFSLERTVGAAAFAAVAPVSGLSLITDFFYEGTTHLLQAGMLARMLFLFRTLGVRRASRFCPLLSPLEADDDGVIRQWSSPSIGTGLHNDVALPGESASFAATAAWRRPAWFTYRRVAWLLSLAEDAGAVVKNAKGFTVLRYRLRAPLSLSLHPTHGYRTLWIAWVDQYADNACLHEAYDPSESSGPSGSAGSDEAIVVLLDALGQGYELVSLVPQVAPSDTDGDTDSNGYRQVTPRDWLWDGWDGALLEHSEEHYWADRVRSVVYLRIRKADPDTAPAPVAILTDADTLLTL